ncbi:tRNA (adenosine(37)-N6)-dimethylallyltransferase MiaA [Piscibacillus sp. B03]|uniref:tRNA (adenosine(37)-N6)-dimethylallyltransferase MiaA n=1 Tax=Piscibacillus sp. B03 TaxID=3457430 RepID=UPI003FCECD99
MNYNGCLNELCKGKVSLVKKPFVVSVIGPTAVGKTKLGIEISKRFNGEVINADSMQFFKEFDIGSAKVTPDEQEGIPHHLIDYLDPDDEYSAANFKNDLHDKVYELKYKNKLPVIVGGTGFYVHSALFDFQFSDVKRDSDYVNQTLNEIERVGIEPFYNRLKEIDPKHAEKIHPHNVRRVIRALEVYDITGKSMSEIEKDQTVKTSYDSLIIGLNMKRETLYERINDRVDLMVEDGLVDEVKNLYHKYGESVQPMQGIGYKEWIPYFKGEYDGNRAIELIKRNTRRFAKRQFTYYRNKIPGVQWYDVDPNNYWSTFENIFKKVEGKLNHL